MRQFLLSGALLSAQADVYCPSAGDLVVAYTNGGDNVQIHDQGWTVTGDGGAATKTAFNLNGGYVEYDMDVSSAHSGVIPNIYSVSPSNMGGDGFNNDKYCDGADNDKPWCMEIDWIEANGQCGGATTLHTVAGPGPDGCTSWGCRTSYHFGGSKFHMKVEYDNSGQYTITRDGQTLGDFSPAPGGGDFETIRSTHEGIGAVIYSSQWTSSWVPPPDDCGAGPGDLEGSSFSISNLRISGTVVQGPTPQTCSGPSPTPPAPSPSPSPGGTCETQVGKNNDGTNLKSSADITTSADACCTKCSETSGCVGYTWVHDNNECWMKSAVGPARDDECGGCVTSGTYTPPQPVPSPTPSPAPTPPPAPSPSPVPGDCPGGSLAACIGMCPTDAAAFQTCVSECTVRCSDTPTCTGGDDGSSLMECMGNCPGDKFQDCADCCSTKFPSSLYV